MKQSSTKDVASPETISEQTLSNIQSKLFNQWADFNAQLLVNDATQGVLNDLGDWDSPVGITPKKETIPLEIGIPDTGSLPKNDLLQSTIKTFNKPGEAALVYGFGRGYKGLRAQLAARYSRNRGLQVSEDWFQLCNGSSGAIDLICRTLIQPGDVIISESPTYMGTLQNFKATQADVRSVPMDERGLLIPDLEALIEQLVSDGKNIKFIYTISTFHNPTGATLALNRRVELLAIAAKYGILILDDDAYGELYFDKPPPTALSVLSGGYGVITVGSFSKILATGLRIGWIHAHLNLLELFGKMRFAMGINQVMVRVVSDYIADGRLDAHAKGVRLIYQKKMETLADALQRHAGEFIDFNRPQGGFYLWVKLTQGLNAHDLWRTAAEEGVAFTRGANFFTARADPEQHIRIAYPWTDLDQLEEAALRFGKACRRVHAGDIA